MHVYHDRRDEVTKALTYGELGEMLDTMHLGVSAADMHGSLVGYLCAGGQAGAARVLDALKIESDDAHARDGAHDVLERLYVDSRRQLEDPELGFQPLMPDDERSLEERADALVDWCRGFLGGFGLGGAGVHARLSDDGKEILRDFGAIAASHLSFEGGEEDEGALAEVLEFIRVGAMLLFAEVASSMAPATKTLH